MFLGFLRIESEDTTINYTNMIMQMLESEAEMSRTASGGCVVREENVVKVSCQESAIRTESEKVKYQYEMTFQFTQAMEYAKDGNLVWECKGELKWNATGCLGRPLRTKQLHCKPVIKTVFGLTNVEQATWRAPNIADEVDGGAHIFWSTYTTLIDLSR